MVRRAGSGREGRVEDEEGKNVRDLTCTGQYEGTKGECQDKL